MLEINKTHKGHVLYLIKQLDDESVDLVITSMPYWSMRDYKLPSQIWDGDDNCQHEFKKSNYLHDNMRYRGESSIVSNERNKDLHTGKEKTFGSFCIHCNAWHGNLGHEPSFRLYIQHLKQIFTEIKRVMSKTGTCFVNIGDAYIGGGGGNYGSGISTAVGKDKHLTNISNKPSFLKANKIQSKSLCLIPERFIIMMVDDLGFTAKNKIVWHKRNCMPASSKDRFTVDWEPVFFFSKANKPQFWVNKKTGKLVSKPPAGTNGIKGKDWRLIPCSKCGGNIPDCKRCKGTGKIKSSFWERHDYYFEQQFEPVQQCSIERLNRAVSDKHKWISGPAGQTPHTMNRPRPNIKTKIPKEKKLQDRKKRCVWDITTKGFSEAHFAVFPEKLVETPVLAGCPEFVCSKCGKPRIKIYEGTSQQAFNIRVRDVKEGRIKHSDRKASLSEVENYQEGISHVGEGRKFIGFSDCGCNAAFRPGIVFDPFMGSGTSGRVALRFKRDYIGFDLGYEEMSKKRTDVVQLEAFT